MSTTGIVIHYIGWGRQSPNLRKYIVLNGNFVFNLLNVFQERNPGAKRELPAYTILTQGTSTTFMDQMPTYLLFKKSTFYAGIRIFNSLQCSLTILKNEKTKFQVASRKYLIHTSFLYR
jgi:hypothetical protein